MNAPGTGGEGHPADSGAGCLAPGQARLRELAEEQAALRRVATLVARGVQPGEIFLAVGGEIRRLLDADDAGLARFGPDGAWVVALGGVGDVVNLPVGTRLKLFDYLAPAV